MVSFKNHYKTLGIAPNASAEEIKKKFRKLALQYHPDTNSGNEFAELQFREVQEAYETLSDPLKRSRYQVEWKAHFPATDLSFAYTHTPERILQECEKLSKQVAAMDAFRMNKESIYYRIKEILSEHNLLLLQQAGDQSINKQVIDALLPVFARLHFRQSGKLATALKILAANDDEVLQKIEAFLKHSRQKTQWERYYPVLVVILTIVICLVIYSASQ